MFGYSELGGKIKNVKQKQLGLVKEENQIIELLLQLVLQW